MAASFAGGIFHQAGFSSHFFLLLCQGNFFDEYRIEGRDESNQILLELVAEQLSRALRSALTAQSVKLKLTNKHSPCLTIEVVVVSVNVFFLCEV